MAKIYFSTIKPKKGKIHINKKQCKGCGFCIEYCPRDVLELSEEFNAKGYHPPSIKDEDKCIYCQLCEAICPDFAIFVTLKEEEEEVEKSESRP